MDDAGYETTKHIADLVDGETG